MLCESKSAETSRWRTRSDLQLDAIASGARHAATRLLVIGVSSTRNARVSKDANRGRLSTSNCSPRLEARTPRTASAAAGSRVEGAKCAGANCGAPTSQNATREPRTSNLHVAFPRLPPFAVLICVWRVASFVWARSCDFNFCASLSEIGSKRNRETEKLINGHSNKGTSVFLVVFHVVSSKGNTFRCFLCSQTAVVGKACRN